MTDVAQVSGVDMVRCVNDCFRQQRGTACDLLPLIETPEV